MKKKSHQKKVNRQPPFRWMVLGFCFVVLVMAAINILDSANDQNEKTLSLVDQLRNRAPADSVEGVLQRFLEEEGTAGTQILAGNLFDLTPEALAGAKSEDSDQAQKTAQGEQPRPLQRCSDQKLGFRILCDPQWSYQEYPNAILLIISADPAVTMTVAKVKSDIRFIGQLNRDKLLALGQYANGFQVEDARLAEQRAVRVKGFSSRYPSIRLLDYYLLHDNQLYSIMFSCNPKESWDDYKFLMQKVLDSFSFEDGKDEEKGLSQILHTPEAAP